MPTERSNRSPHEVSYRSTTHSSPSNLAISKFQNSTISSFPQRLNMRNVGEQRDEIGMTHFRSLIQCFHLVHQSNFEKLIVIFDFLNGQLPHIRVFIQPLKELVPNTLTPWAHLHKGPMNQEIQTYSQRVKEAVPISQIPMSVMNKQRKILMWNARRSSSSNFFIFLLHVLQEHQPVILILLEAPPLDDSVRRVRGRYGFTNF